MSLSDLPHLNAILNSLSTLFLVTGYVFIRKGRQTAHRNCMVTAFIVSSAFLTSYLIYHFNVPPVKFRDPAWFKPIYLLILLTHVVLAVVIVPMIFITFFHALKGRFEKHKRMARWTWPLWLYVSVTGVLIYFLLYRIFPQG